MIVFSKRISNYKDLRRLSGCQIWRDFVFLTIYTGGLYYFMKVNNHYVTYIKERSTW